MNWLTNIWKAEPVAIGDGFKLLLIMLMSFGLPLSMEQFGAVMGFVVFVIAAAQRATVTSPKTLEKYYNDTAAAFEEKDQQIAVLQSMRPGRRIPRDIQDVQIPALPKD